MRNDSDKRYVKWGLTALAVIFVSIVLVVIFIDLPGFFAMLRALGAAACAERGDFTFEDQTELFRMYSAEIEYSEENLETLYELLWSAANEQK